MKKKTVILICISALLFLIGCSPSTKEIKEKHRTLHQRYSMLMSYEGCYKNCTLANPDRTSREAQLNMVAKILPETFKYLNGEIEYLQSNQENEENKELVEKYKKDLGDLLAEHIQIFRLVFVELSNKNPNYWGKLRLEGENHDVLIQDYESKTQKEVIQKEVNSFMLMRFKKVIRKSKENMTDEVQFESASDRELIPMTL